MKKVFISALLLLGTLGGFSQVAVISREQKIAKFNETAIQKAALYQNYRPKPSIYEISDDFKANHKYLYTWVQDDVLRIASDAQIGLFYVKILEQGTRKELCSIDRNYQSAPVFADKVSLTELRAKMPGGTKGFYQVYYATADRYSGRITYDETHIVKSPNPAPVEKGPKLKAIQVKFTTMDHDKEAGKWVAIKVTKKTRAFTDYYKYTVGSLSIEDPAKWDYGNVQNFTINTTANNTYLSDFANGGNLTVSNMPGDLWDVIINIKMEFSDGTAKYFRKRKTSNTGYGTVLCVDFDKDFKIIKEYAD